MSLSWKSSSTRSGLTPHLERVFNSAKLGYEKPNPQTYAQVAAAFPGASQFVMIGDNITADVRGARAFGWPAVLVRTHDPAERHACVSLVRLPEALIAALAAADPHGVVAARYLLPAGPYSAERY
jgi:FMN phosphatase YigB (HAD superfamily)